MIEVDRTRDNEYRVKLYHPDVDNGKLQWVDTDHLFGDYHDYLGFYMNPSVIPNQDLREAGWKIENRFYFGE